MTSYFLDLFGMGSPESTTHQSLVRNFNVNFGVLEEGIPLQENVYSSNPELAEFCLKLIREEILELSDAVKSHDLLETADALGDILYVVYGMLCRLGVTNADVKDSGVPYGYIPYTPKSKDIVRGIFTSRPGLMMGYVSIIFDTLASLETAVSTKEFASTVNFLVELLHDVYSFSERLGLDIDGVFRKIHENNMSKFCKTIEEAVRSVEYYSVSPGVYDSPRYRLAPNGLYVIFNESTKKILKSVDYTPVDLREFV